MEKKRGFQPCGLHSESFPNLKSANKAEKNADDKKNGDDKTHLATMKITKI